MTDTDHGPVLGDGSDIRPEDMIEFFLAHMSQHVMAKIGMGAVDGGEGHAMTLTPAPVTLDADGHIDFGVLGVFFDMAASGAFEDRGGVHADISVTRLRPPSGVMMAAARPARAGRRTGVVEVDLRDETGALVATSTQEIAFRERPEGAPDREGGSDRMRDRFRSLFDGSCRLEAPLADTLDVERRGDTWHMDLGDDRTNGGGALHGGCGIAFVEAAANAAAQDVLGRSRTLSAAVRYLAPARVGPFVARPELTWHADGLAVQRVRVTDSGQDGRSVMLADVQSVARVGVKRADKAIRIGEILDELYPDPPVPLDHVDPYTLLVAVALSAQTTDKKVNEVTPALFAAADTPEKMAALAPDEILGYIAQLGLAPTKARNLSTMAHQILEAGGMRADFEFLESLAGVGHKTASVVMAQAYGVPAFAVDTHIHRLAARWGLSRGTTVERTERDLKAVFARDRWNDRHLQIIFFGREYCPARHHDLAQCPICSWAATKKRIAAEARGR